MVEKKILFIAPFHIVTKEEFVLCFSLRALIGGEPCDQGLDLLQSTVSRETQALIDLSNLAEDFER